MTLLFFLVALRFLAHFLVDQTMHALDLCLIFNLLLLDLFSLFLEFLYALVTEFVLFVSKLSQGVGFGLYELADAVTHQVLRL